MHRPDGTPAGTNKIRAILDGCVLEESYQAAKGNYRGQSLNIYDATRGTWNQTWVDNGGLLLKLEGKWDQGRMVLSGHTVEKSDTEDPTKHASTLHEIAWEPLPDGKVRQHWRSSKDEGQTWNDLFIGIYTRVAE